MTRQLIYPCHRPEIRPLGKGVKIDYDGAVLVVMCGHYLAAITARRGETVQIKIQSDGIISCHAS